MVHVLRYILKGQRLIIINHFTQKMSEANDESCPISRETIQVVEDCPDSSEKWNEAAERKNCAAFAAKCSKPQKLQYHCVINPSQNETIEVCAYAQYTVFGKKLPFYYLYIL